MFHIAEYFASGINAFFWVLGLVMMLVAAWIIFVLVAWIVNRITGKPKDGEDDESDD